jgi:ABC-2 type transport system ATP-binding protein
MDPVLTDTRAAPAGNEATGSRALALETRQLKKRYGRSNALCGLDMQVPLGSVYALLGRNGAGKSTLIQLALGLLEPSGGQIRVLGLDPVRNGVELKRRIGYIPEHLPMYEWLTVDETLRMVAALYPTWSREEEDRLLARFRIPRSKKIRELSRGNRALLALVLAMSHNPELVLLDECTSGMDPVFRREFDRCVIEALHGTGRSVLFASHQIRELERICDWVGIISEGKILLQMPVDDLKASVKMLRVILGGGSVEDLPLDGVVERRRAGREWLITVRGYAPGAERRVMAAGSQVVEVIDLDLEDIFVALLSGEALETWAEGGRE